MRLLVTGASGLIGSRVVVFAFREGIEVIASGRNRPATLPSDVSFHQADLTDARQAVDMVRKVAPTHLVHSAWETRRPTYWEDASNIDWLVSTTRMAQAFAECGGRRFVQVGSCASYDWSLGYCIEGRTPDRPSTRYGSAKSATFRAIEAVARGAFEACEARIFLLYGPGEEETRFIPLICRRHLAGLVPEIGSGRQVRDLLHADDVGNALLAIARTEGLKGVVNVGSGEPVTLAEVATLLSRIAGAKQTGLGSKPSAEGEPSVLVPDVTRLRSTGWKPSVNLEDGLSATYAWWRARSSSVA